MCNSRRNYNEPTKHEWVSKIEGNACEMLQGVRWPPAACAVIFVPDENPPELSLKRLVKEEYADLYSVLFRSSNQRLG